MVAAPSANAAVHARFTGTQSCNSQAETCTYSWAKLHYADVVEPDAGIGTAILNGIPVGSCTFAGLLGCTARGMAGTVLAGMCSPACNPY